MDHVVRTFRLLVTRIARDDPARLHQPLQVSEVYQRWIPYRHYKGQLSFDAIDDYDMALLQLFAGAQGLVTLDPPDAQAALVTELEAVDPDPGAFREFAAARVILSPDAVQDALGDGYAFEPRRAPPVIPAAPQAPTGRAATDELEEEEEARWAPPMQAPAAPPEVTAEPDPVPPPAPEPAPPEPAAPPPAPEPPPPDEPDHAPQRDATPPPDADVGAVPRDAELCPQCRGSMPSQRRANFCPHCGTVIGPRRCVQCGERVEEHWSFCLGCGSMLRR